MMEQFEKFLRVVSNAIEIQDTYALRNWVTQEEYFDLLTTATLETLNQHTRQHIQEGGKSEELQFLLDGLLLRRYLLSGQFEAFFRFTAENRISVPPPLKSLLKNWSNQQPAYQSQIELINGIVDLQLDDALLARIIKDIRFRFIEHLPFVNIAVTFQHAETHQPLMRPAFTFLIASHPPRKVRTKDDIFRSAQTIDTSFIQATEDIQRAMLLTDSDGNRYWYELDLFQKLVERGKIPLNGKSAGAGIGWLIFLIEADVPIYMPQIISIWGTYDAYRRCFQPVNGLKEKLDACREDGLRIIGVPQITLEQYIRPGLTFRDYANGQGMQLIPFPDDMPIPEVYPFIYRGCQELGIIAPDPGAQHIVDQPDQPPESMEIAVKESVEGSIVEYNPISRHRLLAFLALILIMGVPLYHLRDNSVRPFPPNVKGILIAPFIDENSESSVYGKKVAAILEEKLGQRLGQMYDIQRCRAVISSEQAQRQGEKSNAILVIWGKVIQFDFEDKKLIYPKMTVVATEARQYIPTPNVRLSGTISALVDIELSPQFATEPKQLIDFTHGVLAYLQGEYQAAIDLFTHAIEEAPMGSQERNISAIYFYRANSYLGQQAYDQAIDDYQNGIDLNPESAELYTNLGAVYNGIGQYTTAIQVLKRAIQLQPNLAMAYVNLSSALNSTKRYQRAISLLKTALEFNPEISIAHNNLGIAYRHIGAYQQSEDHLKQAIEIEPDLAIAHLSLANLYLKQERFSEAIEEFRTTLGLNATLVEAYHNLGLLYRLQGQYQQAIEQLEKAVQLNPVLVDAHCNLGDAYFLNHQHHQALSAYLTAVQLDPQHARAHYQLACIYSLEGQTADALESLRAAIRFDAQYRERAKTDADFSHIKPLEEFQQLVDVGEDAERLTPTEAGSGESAQGHSTTGVPTVTE